MTIEQVEETAKNYQFHEEYATREEAEEVARRDGYKHYIILPTHACYHYLYDTDK